MIIRPVLTAAVVCVALVAAPVHAAEEVPFRGAWSGQTISATFINPDLVFVISAGPGQATHLGRFTMESPHFTTISTFEVVGEQLFTAANGDTVRALITGQFVPTPEGNLEATLTGVITGGTGRFAGATGSYDFMITARPIETGFASTAIFAGTISSPGSLK